MDAPTEFLNSLSLGSYPPHVLELKYGAPFILLRNLDPQNGHVNGGRYVIVGVTKRIIHGRLAVGPKRGNEILLPRIKLDVKDKQLPFRFTRHQFPIKLAFAFTVHKSQGQSLRKVGIYLKNDFFGHGMCYVAGSRITQPSGLKIHKPMKALPPPQREVKKTNDLSKIKNSKKKEQSKPEESTQPNMSGDQYMKNIVYQEILTK